MQTFACLHILAVQTPKWVRVETRPLLLLSPSQQFGSSNPTSPPTPWQHCSTLITTPHPPKRIIRFCIRKKPPSYLKQHWFWSKTFRVPRGRACFRSDPRMRQHHSSFLKCIMVVRAKSFVECVVFMWWQWCAGCRLVASCCSLKVGPTHMDGFKKRRRARRTPFLLLLGASAVQPPSTHTVCSRVGVLLIYMTVWVLK